MNLPAVAIAKLSDIQALLQAGRAAPASVLLEIEAFAASLQWQTREVAATAMVEIGKRHPAFVLQHARAWAKNKNPNLRRAASESLRGIVKIDPHSARTVIELLREDAELYVKKSVANVLRNASGKHSAFVLGVCRDWARSSSPHTHWIVKHGLRKLQASHPEEVAAILASLPATRRGKIR